ncbi:MAG: hypothetical protein IPM63_11920 [Acidobacteriota bacterium]|nr:MAG: hypothetical protein IPM63_11920 [Acidobacteriota bacterium]
MYCPRCGQERFSEATSFCSRCGLFLDHLEEVMHNDGNPLFEAVGAGSDRLFSRRNVRIFTLFWFVIVTVILTPVSAILEAPEEITAILGLIGPVVALMTLILSFLLPKDGMSASRKERRKEVRELREERERKGLPPDQTVFADDFIPPRAERPEPVSGERSAAPPSVTEETTRHLKIEEDD